jgi:hypothetical protein
MLRFITALLVTCLILSCSKSIKSSSSGSFNGIPQVEFCDLIRHEGQLVYVKAAYSGVDEYWALNSLKKCGNNLNVELDDRSGEPIPSKFQAAFDSAYASYWDTYLIVEATGVFESKNLGGYGHLESNKARLIMKEYINVTLVKKKKVQGLP